MISILAHPTQAPKERGRGLYVMEFRFGDRSVPLMKVRAKTGAEAEEMLGIVFRHELSGKTLDFDPGEWREGEEENEDEDETDGRSR